MQLIGKIVGSFLGYLMAGPFGLLLGLFIGNFFDKGLKKHLSQQQYAAYFSEKRPQIKTSFIKTISCLMGLIAKADGRVSEAELQFANYMFTLLKLNLTELETAQQWFTTSKNGQVSHDDQVRMLHYLKQVNLKLCKCCLDITYQMAKIDGLTQSKINLMNELLTSIGFAPLETIFNAHEFWQKVYTEHAYQQHQRRRRSSSSSYGSGSYRSYQSPPRNTSLTLGEAFTVLGLQVTAGQAEVKKAYRKLMSKYHPDKMIAKGASSQELKQATEKTQQISKAYSYICDYKGW
jgi:DnaJ like chaperone protein